MKIAHPARRLRTVSAAVLGACLCASAWAGQDACVAAAPSANAGDAAQFDARQTFQSARTLARNGEYDAALREYRRLSAHHPDDVDYLFGEAQVRFWAGDAGCALELASRARQLAPGYEDIWQLEHRLLQVVHKSGDENGDETDDETGDDAPVDTSRLESFRNAAGARFPGAAWLRVTPESNPVVVRWETGVDRESLDNGAADWQNLYAYIDRRTADGHLLSLTLTEHRRFSLVDNEVAVGGAFRLAGSWLVEGALRSTPHADFLAKVIGDAGVKRQLGHGWLAGADFRYRHYPDDTVNTWGLNVERYFGSFRAAYHLGNTRLSTSSSFMHSGVLNYYAESGSRYGLTVAAGDEVEVVAPGQLLEMDISAVGLSGRHPVGEGLSLLWRIGTHRQGSLYRRNSVGLSIAGEF